MGIVAPSTNDPPGFGVPAAMLGAAAAVAAFVAAPAALVAPPAAVAAAALPAGAAAAVTVAAAALPLAALLVLLLVVFVELPQAARNSAPAPPAPVCNARRRLRPYFPLRQIESIAPLPLAYERTLTRRDDPS